MKRSLIDRQHAVNIKDAPRSDAGDAFSSLVIHVFRLNGLLLAAGDRLASAAGQTSARWQVLAAVDKTPSSVAHIARALNLARQSVQRVADVLEREGLATYVENPNHRRAKLLQLTSTGRQALKAIQTAQRPWADALGNKLGEQTLRRTTEILASVLKALSAERS